MKLFQSVCEFNYPWEEVTAANWKKYPNEVSTHVVATDVLRRELDPSGKRLVSERLFTVQQPVPKWILMLVCGQNVSHVREVSTVDLESKTLTLRSCNLTYANLMKVTEVVTYSPHPDDPKNKTLFHQTATITAYAPFSRVCNRLEEWSVQRYHENAEKGRRGFESVLVALSKHWHQGERYMDDLGNTIVGKVSGTVDDLLTTSDPTSILNTCRTQIDNAFNRG